MLNLFSKTPFLTFCIECRKFIHKHASNLPSLLLLLQRYRQLIGRHFDFPVVCKQQKESVKLWHPHNDYTRKRWSELATIQVIQYSLSLKFLSFGTSSQLS